MFFKKSEKCYENASQHFELWVTDFFEKSKNKKNTSLTLKILIMLEWCASTISWPLLCFGFKKSTCYILDMDFLRGSEDLDIYKHRGRNIYFFSVIKNLIFPSFQSVTHLLARLKIKINLTDFKLLVFFYSP